MSCENLESDLLNMKQEFEQDFTENADVGVGFTFDSTNGTVQYTTTSTGTNATLNYRITKFN